MIRLLNTPFSTANQMKSNIFLNILKSRSFIFLDIKGIRLGLQAFSFASLSTLESVLEIFVEHDSTSCQNINATHKPYISRYQNMFSLVELTTHKLSQYEQVCGSSMKFTRFTYQQDFRCYDVMRRRRLLQNRKYVNNTCRDVESGSFLSSLLCF